MPVPLTLTGVLLHAWADAAARKGHAESSSARVGEESHLVRGLRPCSWETRRPGRCAHAPTSLAAQPQGAAGGLPA